ncbi:D-hexose-6-phosphate mutarotase [Stutzerimonas azotifigens]|uniref:Putative glucose-6-phosphate 1-epimerase n=1 Tax=Stutzerimonas azotifigens TaxID=291995 RepID=A0ABR5Z424_9GAMM|nr:D-hexose-6-phosphate mutarotase [Stutzerimonas azotifigens]MBA1274962.1 D-hexose-6-phosphate mutarotase [Stutzerimonas azotifigens]
MPADIQRLEQDQLSCWRIRHGDAELLVAEQGAQVLDYRRGDAPPIIWLSEEAALLSGQSVRGGVPVCWPWFGDLARNPQSVQQLYEGEAAPAHGLVRAIDWTMDEPEVDTDGVTLRLRCPQAEQGWPQWPQRMGLQLEIRLDQALHLSLITDNRGDQAVSFSQALHTYFAISDIHQVSVEGLADRRYIETLENWEPRQQHGDLRFSGETDRVYLGLAPTLSLMDPAWKRRIVLQSRGSASAVLWNPWIAKAQRLSHFADDAWQRMLCIETANVLDDLVTLAPGASHTLGLTIDSQPLR